MSKLLFQPKINFCWKYPQTLISHNLRMSHQDLKKISGIHIDHARNKICKNEGFLKVSLFDAAWFLQKMGWTQWYSVVVIDWNTVHCHLHFISIEIPDDTQINDELYTFCNFNQGTNLWFDSIESINMVDQEIYAIFPMCVCYFYYCCYVANYLPRLLKHYIVIAWIFSKNISTIYDMY